MSGDTTQHQNGHFREEKRGYSGKRAICSIKGGKRMSAFVLGFQDIDKTKLMVVGGKGANQGELSKIEGIHVPDGFCISNE
jgi:Pyruvate phosphate dikinase, AMP/ATP-binding domain